ncbi:MAG: hypothetical protein ABSE40_12080 [Candidatus Sulfotelmatobacter sp.]
MKRTRILVTLLATLALLSSSCGTGDKISSVSITAAGQAGTINLIGLGGTLQLQVMANYTSGKQINETNFATYTITPEGTLWDQATALPTPPYGIQLNNTGMIAATATQNGNGICTWLNANTTSTQLSSPSWFYTGDYTIVATYRGFTSNPIYIPVASGASGQTGQEGICGPSAAAQ